VRERGGATRADPRPGAARDAAVTAAPAPAEPVASAAPPATATQRVYEGIYRAMLEHRLAPGARLREEELAATFGVSRTVVRQALQRLAQDGLIELLHNRGARVPQPGLDDAAHVFEARRVVECEIARRLGGRLDDAQLATLRELATAEALADAAGDRGAAVRLSGEFHRALARMHGNPVFLRLLDGLLPTTSMLMAVYKRGGGAACVAHRHVDLIDALARGAPAAAAEMRRHLQELERSLTRPGPGGGALRDVFAPYREVPAPDGADG
jgi:DNA-binding GntR family transcriptional regulator